MPCINKAAAVVEWLTSATSASPSEAVARSPACVITRPLSCTARPCSDVAAFPNLSNYFKEMTAKDTSCKPEISSYKGKTLSRSCTLSCFAWAALIKIPPSDHKSTVSSLLLLPWWERERKPYFWFHWFSSIPFQRTPLHRLFSAYSALAHFM